MKDLITEIRSAINEELGISKIVNAATKEIFDTIVSDSEQDDWFGDRKKGDFDIQVRAFGNVNINVVYDVYRVQSVGEFTKPVKPYSTPSSNGFTLKTFLLYVKGTKQYIDYKGGMQHEVEHIYQMLRKHKHLLTEPTSINMYNAAKAMKSSENALIRLVGYVIYYNNDFERDAYINAIYRDVMNNPKQDVYETLRQNPVYKKLDVIKRCILDSNAWDSQIDAITQAYFGKSVEWLRKMTERMLKTYMNKIGKVLAKGQKDLNENKSNFSLMDFID